MAMAQVGEQFYRRFRVRFSESIPRNVSTTEFVALYPDVFDIRTVSASNTRLALSPAGAAIGMHDDAPSADWNAASVVVADVAAAAAARPDALQLLARFRDLLLPLGLHARAVRIRSGKCLLLLENSDEVSRLVARAKVPPPLKLDGGVIAVTLPPGSTVKLATSAVSSGASTPAVQPWKSFKEAAATPDVGDGDSDAISVASEATSVSTVSEPIQFLGAGVQVLPSVSLKDMPDLVAMQERLAQQQRVLDEARKRQAKAQAAPSPAAAPTAASTDDVQKRLAALLANAQNAALGVSTATPTAAVLAVAPAAARTQAPPTAPVASAAVPDSAAVDAEVRLIVEDAGMGKYVPNFAGVSFDAFVALTDRDLQQMGLTVMGPRLKVLRFIQAAAADVASGGAERALRAQRIAADKAVSGAMRLVDERATGAAPAPVAATAHAVHAPPYVPQSQQPSQLQQLQQASQAQQYRMPPPGMMAMGLGAPYNGGGGGGAPGLGAPYNGGGAPGLGAPYNGGMAPAMVMPNQFTGGPVCVICQTQAASVVFEPCEHMCVCQWCRPGPSLRYLECPLCMVPIQRMRAAWSASSQQH